MLATPPFTAAELIHEINSKANLTLEEIELTEWNEDYISFSLIKSLRSILNNTRIITNKAREPNYTSNPEIALMAEIYKVTGFPERTHGDICVIVNNTSSNKTGTAFYEAKAERHDHTYPAFKMRQLRKLSSSTPDLSLLLYEQTAKAICDNDDNLFYAHHGQSLISSKQRTRVFGANIARQYSSPNHIAEIPNSFGHHFVTRNLTGKGLNYSNPPIELIRKWLKLTKRAPPHVLLIKIGSNIWDDISSKNPSIKLISDELGFSSYDEIIEKKKYQEHKKKPKKFPHLKNQKNTHPSFN